MGNKEKRKRKTLLNILCMLLMITTFWNGKLTVDAARISYDDSLITAVGKQGSQQCMAYALAYCRTILDGYVHSGTEYWKNGVGGMYSWANYTTAGSSNKQQMLKIVYDQINMGRPVCMYVTGHYRENYNWYAPGDHWVTVVGYRDSANPYALNESDFYIIDPGACAYDYLRDGCTKYTSTSLRISNDGGSTISPYESVYVDEIGDTNAKINASLSEVTYLTEGGFYLSKNVDMSGSTRVSETLNMKVKTMWYDMNKWYGTLERGTTYYYQFYIIKNGTEYKSDISSFTTTGDGTNPVIVQAYTKDVDSTGYTVVCVATDNTGISRVCFPTWTEANGQDDLASDWYNATAVTTSVGDNAYEYRVSIGAHSNERGAYITDVYAYDGYGNYTCVRVQETVPRYVPFNDVTSSDWYYTAVADVYEKGYMSGKGNGKFDAAGKLTRAEIAVILYGVEGKPYTTYITNFTDVYPNQWYSNAVSWAYRNGVVSGYGNGKFGTSDNITREQLAVMLYGYAQMKGKDINGNANALESFSDKAQTSSYAVQAMRWAITKGLVSGKGNGTLDPQGQTTRGECAVIIDKFVQNVL